MGNIVNNICFILSDMILRSSSIVCVLLIVYREKHMALKSIVMFYYI